MLNGLEGGVAVLQEQLENVVDNFSLDGFIEPIVGFAGSFLALWAVWIGIRFLLRASRSVR